MGVAIAGNGPKTEILSAAVPKGVKKEVDTLARTADLSRSETTTLLLLAGLAILALLPKSGRAVHALGDQNKVKRLAPRALKRSLDLIRTVERGE